MDRIGEDVYKALSEYDAFKFSLDKYKRFALEKWTYFTEIAVKNRDEIYIIDSALFQFQIFTFLFKNSPYEELQSFVDQIIDIIRPLNPCLIYLYRDNAEATIDYLEKDRGTSYLEYLWNRDKDQPYYEGKPPGAKSFKQFLRDYANMADLLYQLFSGKKLSLEISHGDWTNREDEMLSFLEVKRIPNPEAHPENGVYVNDALGFKISIDGLSFIDPTGQKRKLIAKSHNEFYVDWLPTVLKFEVDKIIIAGSQVCEQWTKTGMEYCKIKQPQFHSGQ
jgi:hypothetical protein